ncbi:MAG TPA: UvrD-helicase domain-containing protein [Pyrinomonadaceae bacterium]|nr:UvrD-helicase domain-containing protein [Pyrinomonadaceae bacterium]
MPLSKRKLEPEQAAAAYAIDRHISVTAGPGSGKTMVLVERYLHVLRTQKLNIDQIVAITFTNRAANEMRERLRAQLNQLLRLATDAERKLWLGYKRTLDGAVITTIHGFCARLLREFPVEARVDPQFVLLDEHRAAMLLESVVEETLTEFISSGHVEISRLTLGVGRGKLAVALADLYRDVRGQGLSFSDLARATADSHATELDHAEALSNLSRCMNDFLIAPRKTEAAKTNRAEVSSRWATLQSLLQTIPEPENLAEYLRAIESFREDVRPTARGDLKSYVNAVDELVWEKDLRGRVPQICLDLFAKQYALEIVNIIGRIHERLNAEKQKLSALDFDDLETRTLELLENAAVLTRAAERYKFFLVDEFQDTNGLQRRLLERLALQKGRRESANLFIVGDRKQSIYGFRGADVDVFRAMTESLIAAGGIELPLLLNFRSQPPLIHFFNHLFERLFTPLEEVSASELNELGYVAHEQSEPKREQVDAEPLVELMITTTEGAGAEGDQKAEQDSRELDAAQLAQRIVELVGNNDSPKYSDIALLFRAMTNVGTYESAFRRANIPYQTVLGRGFYERPEITDLIQLLRFLDNKTDEIALAAVLRSPLCGISDNALLALRCGPTLAEVEAGNSLKHFNNPRRLFTALRVHRELAYIDDEEHVLLDRVAALLQQLIARRHHYGLGDLLRFAVEQSEYLTVVAATFDGAQRLANVQRLFTLAERFESAGTHLIRDFVRYVEEFEAIGSRESEGQIDEAANAVRLMTIHQAKGLEFPIVVIPDLHRSTRPMDSWVLLDRHQGLTLRVPDGRGKSVAGRTFARFNQRHETREHFESMRLLYVAATRAQDRLILSGASKDLESLVGKTDTWLKWIWNSLDVPLRKESGIIELSNGVQVQLRLNSVEQTISQIPQAGEGASAPTDGADSLLEAFPLLQKVEAQTGQAVNRFSVTQLINYQRCPRQYYFDRVLHAPSTDAVATWNDAEAPEPPANLTATLKGAVLHRFCETFQAGEDASERLLRSFKEVTAARQAELAERWMEIDTDKVVNDLLPLAHNYLASDVFKRVELARRLSVDQSERLPQGAGLWSEVPFRLRRPLGLLTGAIDKLLVTRNPDDDGFEIEIVDFKTNRFINPVAEVVTPGPGVSSTGSSRKGKGASTQQIAFDFSSIGTTAPPIEISSIEDEVARVAADYQLQMQAYALAVRELMPATEGKVNRVKVTLHFLDPNQEFQLSESLLDQRACELAIDEAMREIAGAHHPTEFPVNPARHCRMCKFLELCYAGRLWLRA